MGALRRNLKRLLNLPAFLLFAFVLLLAELVRSFFWKEPEAPGYYTKVSPTSGRLYFFEEQPSRIKRWLRRLLG